MQQFKAVAVGAAAAAVAAASIRVANNAQIYLIAVDNFNN